MKHLIQLAAGVAILAAVSCGAGAGSDNNSVDSPKAVNDSLTKIADATRVDTPSTAATVTKDDTEFAIKAANGGMEEVEMGKLAQSNAINQRVKDFGAMMVKDHAEAGDKLKAIAQQKNITLPAALGDKEQKMVNDLQKKQGKEFDKAYMDMMLDDHKKDIKEFTKASSDCKDSDLKNFASTALPTLQKHLDSVKAITGKQ